MQQNKLLVLFSIFGISLTALAQQPTNATSPVLLKSNNSSNQVGLTQVTGQQAPQNPTIPGQVLPLNTLKKVESFERQKMELEMRTKAISDLSLNQMQSSSNANLGQVVKAEPPPPPPKPVASTVKVPDEYYTLSVVSFKGETSADVAFPGGVMTVKVGDLVDGWTISRISIEGVQIQKIHPITKKSKQQKVSVHTLKPYSLSAAFNVSLSIPGQVPIQNSKTPANQDSTGIQMAGGLPQLPPVAPIVK